MAGLKRGGARPWPRRSGDGVEVMVGGELRREGGWRLGS